MISALTPIYTVRKNGTMRIQSKMQTITECLVLGNWSPSTVKRKSLNHLIVSQTKGLSANKGMLQYLSLPILTFVLN